MEWQVNNNVNQTIVPSGEEECVDHMMELSDLDFGDEISFTNCKNIIVLYWFFHE